MKAVQNVLGLIGIVLGVIPLLQYLLAGGLGLWTFLVGEAPPLAWAYPVGAIVVAGIGILVIDRIEEGAI